MYHHAGDTQLPEHNARILLSIHLLTTTVWNHTPTTHALTLRITTHHAYNLVQHSINNVKCSMLGYFAHNKIRNIRRHKGRVRKRMRALEDMRMDSWAKYRHTRNIIYFTMHTGIVNTFPSPGIQHPLFTLASTSWYCSYPPHPNGPPLALWAQYDVTVINFHP